MSVVMMNRVQSTDWRINGSSSNRTTEFGITDDVLKVWSVLQSTCCAYWLPCWERFWISTTDASQKFVFFLAGHILRSNQWRWLHAWWLPPCLNKLWKKTQSCFTEPSQTSGSSGVSVWTRNVSTESAWIGCGFETVPAVSCSLMYKVWYCGFFLFFFFYLGHRVDQRNSAYCGTPVTIFKWPWFLSDLVLFHGEQPDWLTLSLSSFTSAEQQDSFALSLSFQLHNLEGFVCGWTNEIGRSATERNHRISACFSYS